MGTTKEILEYAVLCHNERSRLMGTPLIEIKELENKIELIREKAMIAVQFRSSDEEFDYTALVIKILQHGLFSMLKGDIIY